MKHSSVLLVFPVLILLSACFGTEEAIEPYPRGDVNEKIISMTASYADQYFFSLDKNEVVAQVKKTDWDIAFSCTPNNSTIRLNTGKNMYAAQTAVDKLSDVSDTNGLNFTWDWSNGREDSTALYNWEFNTYVYVIDLGMDEENTPLGFVKAIFESQNDEVFVRYSGLKDTQEYAATLSKDDYYNHVYYSFLHHEKVVVEPLKTDYDLVFRQYIYYFEPEDLAYLVVGALLSPNETKVSRIFDKPFEEIVAADTSKHSFSNASDVIGYDWKEFILSEGVYVVYANQNYVIRDSKGFLYKLHFTDFYSSSGERGYPKLEFKRL